MPRRPRLLVDGGYYHLLARGNNRLFVFDVEGDRGYTKFKDLMKESKERFSWKIMHYCLMANHIHILGWIERGVEMPQLMQFLLLGYSRWYRKRASYVGHLWQGRYKSPLIEKESYFLECGRYIERNPVRAGIVKRVKDYRWTSYRHYAYGEGDPLLDDSPYYEGMDLMTLFSIENSLRSISRVSLLVTPP